MRWYIFQYQLKSIRNGTQTDGIQTIADIGRDTLPKNLHSRWKLV